MLCPRQPDHEYKGVLRGLYFQKQYAPGKLVRVIRVAVFEVVDDLRSEARNMDSGLV